MHIYKVYDFILESPYFLHGYPEASGQADVRIERVSLEEIHLSGNRKIIQPEGQGIQSNGGDISLGYVGDYLKFWVQKGEMIGIDPAPDLDNQTIRALLQGVLMATLLRQRGFLTLHGAGLARDGGAIAILGNSGWGKSTLSSYLSDHGFALLGDDIVAIDTRVERGPVIVPGFPVARLRPDAAQHLSSGKRVSKDLFGKTRLHLSDANYKTSFPLKAIYVLEPEPRTTNRVVRCTGTEGLLHLIEHTRVTNLIVHPDYKRAHLQQCKAVLNHVPTYVLQRKHGLSELGHIREVMEEEVRKIGM